MIQLQSVLGVLLKQKLAVTLTAVILDSTRPIVRKVHFSVAGDRVFIYFLFSF